MSDVLSLLENLRKQNNAKEPRIISHSWIDGAAIEYDALRARIRTLEGLLAKSEWGAFDYDAQRNFCWSCGAVAEGFWNSRPSVHREGCELKAALDGGADA